MNDTLTEIGPAFVAALADLEDIAKTSTADMGGWSYRYADLGAVLAHVRPVLARHGLAVHQEAHSVDVGVVAVTTTVWHTSGQSIRSEPLTMPARGGAQDVGSAITYARRYALMTFLGLASEDDDGSAAQAAKRRADERVSELERRVRAVAGELRTLTDERQADMKRWAGDRSLSAQALRDDEAWLVQVESWLDEHTSGEAS